VKDFYERNELGCGGPMHRPYQRPRQVAGAYLANAV